MTVINHRKHNNLTANKKNMVNKTKKSCRDLFLQLFLHLQFGTRIHLNYIATIYANHLGVASLMHRYVYTFQNKNSLCALRWVETCSIRIFWASSYDWLSLISIRFRIYIKANMYCIITIIVSKIMDVHAVTFKI